MERIALADRFFTLVDSGVKTTTIRYKRRNYNTGDGMFYSDTSDLTRSIYINNVEYKTFGELTNADAITDGFKNLAELKSELLSFYPDCKETDEITRVTFYKT